MKRDDFAIDFSSFRSDPRWRANLYWHVSDRISYMLWPKNGASLKRALRIAPEGVRRFYLTGTVQGPVEDGGLGQYFARRRPTWLHEMAKQEISNFDCHHVVTILEEAELYVRQNRASLRDVIKLDEWLKIMGVVAMNRALNDINGRCLRACSDLDDAKERYLRKHRELFQ